MSNSASVLLVDDDPWFSKAFRARFEAAFPDVRMDSVTEPKIEPGYGVYFVDNEFDGKCLAGELARQIRALDLDALIIAISANLDAVTLKTLINLGCNGAFDKSAPNSLLEVFAVVRKYFEARVLRSNKKRPQAGAASFRRSAQSLRC